MSIQTRLKRCEEKTEATAPDDPFRTPILFDPDVPGKYHVGGQWVSETQLEELMDKFPGAGIVPILPLRLGDPLKLVP